VTHLRYEEPLWLHPLGLHRLDHLNANGEPSREPGTITDHRPGHMIHVDVKTVGRIATGGGWHVHGRGLDQKRAVRPALPT